MLRTVKANLIHPTALEIYGMTRAVDPTISMGTVYRNLNLLAEQGKILRIKVPGGADRYDGTIEPHNHAVCTKCGMVMDYSYSFDIYSENREPSFVNRELQSGNYLVYLNVLGGF